jgi:uncharacterized Zn-finger protein
MKQSNAETLVEVTRDELPMHCPAPSTTAWNSHPRVFIPLHETDEARCSYCGTLYRLVDKKTGNDSTN